ncbi:AI-2E family transporter [Natrarchaeobius halalkaliphilus]|uniref:AI-2E family transporter n=1 Tax=Natrarchaeobius halalkaliphilus TaxID=1679091 RepID=A0A3N6MZX1_9EURY|nr:AI-2E family transporter [Natrarchaeobius halalkaliphilus]RQG91162.1 AI-2E family transporter [Natrarchaeobius halalkaliphilus]
MNVRTTFFVVLLLALGAIAALMIVPLLQYVMAAAFLAFVLHPVHARLERRVGSRISALLLTAVAVVGIVVPFLLVSLIVLQTAASFLRDVDGASLIERVRTIARDDLGLDEEYVHSIESALLAEIDSSLSNAIEVALFELVGLVNTSIEMGLGLIVFVFLLYYLLADGRTFIAWLTDVIPLEEEVRSELFSEIDVVTWAVIKSHVLVAVVEGVLGGFGLYLLGVPNVAFWTVVMIVVAFLPAAGVWLVWGPAVGYLALVSGPVPAVALLLYGVTVLSLIDNYLRAYFVDRGSGLHPAVVIIGVIGGIYLLGIMGLFLGPVLLAVFKAGITVFSRTTTVTGDGDRSAASTVGSLPESEPESPTTGG